MHLHHLYTSASYIKTENWADIPGATITVNEWGDLQYATNRRRRKSYKQIEREF